MDLSFVGAGTRIGRVLGVEDGVAADNKIQELAGVLAVKWLGVASELVILDRRGLLSAGKHGLGHGGDLCSEFGGAKSIFGHSLENLLEEFLTIHLLKARRGPTRRSTRGSTARWPTTGWSTRRPTPRGPHRGSPFRGRAVVGRQ